jgi:DNA repair exonuclease SbcCD ATPase subunit
LVEIKDNKLLELEKSLRLVSDEYEYEIVKLNKILKDKEDEFEKVFNKKLNENMDYEKEISKLKSIIHDLESKCNFLIKKNNECDQFCKDYEDKIQNLENQLSNLNGLVMQKEKIILEYEDKLDDHKNEIIQNLEYNMVSASPPNLYSQNNNRDYNSFYAGDRSENFINSNKNNDFNDYDVVSSMNFNNENENIFLRNQLRERGNKYILCIKSDILMYLSLYF